MIYKSTSTRTRMSTGIFRINVIISLVLCLILLISPSRAFQRTIFKKLRSELNLLRADERRAFAPAFSPPLLSFLTKKSLLDVVPRGGDQDQELNGDNHEAEANEDEDEYEYEQESSEDEEDLPDDELISSSSYTSTSSVESQLQSLDDADTITVTDTTDTDTDTAATAAATSTAAAASPSKSESKQSESSLAIWGSVSSAFQMNIDAKDELIHNNTNTITTNNANECEHDYANTVSDTDTAPDNDDKFENAHDEYDDNEELIEEEYDKQDCTALRPSILPPFSIQRIRIPYLQSTPTF